MVSANEEKSGSEASHLCLPCVIFATNERRSDSEAYSQASRAEQSTAACRVNPGSRAREDKLCTEMVSAGQSWQVLSHDFHMISFGISVR